MYVKIQETFHGVFPYLVSPIDNEGKVKAGVLEQLVDHLIEAGVHGLAPLGSTGEAAYLNWEQRRTIVEVTLSAAKGRVPVIAGVESTSTHEAVRQAQAFADMGVSGIVAFLSTYFPLREADVVDYFKTVARAVSCPVVLYVNPRFTGVDLSISAFQQLIEVPNIMYYKDATGDTGRLLSLRNAIGDRIKIFSASAHVPLFVMMLGGVGWMAGPACLIPRASVQLYELARQRRWEEAMDLQRRLWRVNEVFQRYSLAACIKAGLEMQGFPVGNPIAPQRPLDKEARQEVAKVLAELNALTVVSS